MTGYRAKAVFDDYRKGWKDAGRSQPAPLDRFAYMGFVAVGKSEGRGVTQGRAGDELCADQYAGLPNLTRTRPVSWLRAMQPNLSSAWGGAGPTTRWRRKAASRWACAAQGSVADTIAGGLMFAGTPDQVYDQVVDFYQAVGGFGHFLMMSQAGQMGSRRHDGEHDAVRARGHAATAGLSRGGAARGVTCSPRCQA